MMRGRLCLAHPFHDEAVPIETHYVRPLARGGMGSATVLLCANAHGSIHQLLDYIEAVAVVSPYATVAEVIGQLPQRVWATYSGIERVIAYRGWKIYGGGFLSGRYERHFRLWLTDGSARRADVPAFTDILHAARWSKRWKRELERL